MLGRFNWGGVEGVLGRSGGRGLGFWVVGVVFGWFGLRFMGLACMKLLLIFRYFGVILLSLLYLPVDSWS